MLCEEINSEQLFAFIKELFSSIRETNKRLEELKWIYNIPTCNEETKQEIRNRFKRLQETKFCLIYSVYDTRTQFIKTFGPEQYQKVLGTTKLYKKLKEL